MDSLELSKTHRKRLAQILRYIASMHQILTTANGETCSFVNDYPAESEFFERQNRAEERNGVLFSTASFRQLISIERMCEKPLFASPPFSFYAAALSDPHENRKRSITGAFKSTFSFSKERLPDKSCWLRVTRFTRAHLASRPEIKNNSAVQAYLDDWKQRAGVSSTEQLLSLENISRSPKVPLASSARDIAAVKRFLGKYKAYLQREAYRASLEPMYNKLFEWTQSQQDHQQELVWGLGLAQAEQDGIFVSGPLLEVLVEVELAHDGALLVRPREHTGVALNRQVIAAVANMFDSHNVLSQLHRTVSELDACALSPGQPETYAPLLKRIALELSPSGSYQTSVESSSSRQLTVSDSWCLFVRPKPSSVWARDAIAFADRLMLSNPPQLPSATWSLTHGPGTFEDIVKGMQCPRQSSGFFNWFKRAKKDAHEGILGVSRPIFPLPTSEAQDQIAELLMVKQYPVCVVEGPPGTGKTHSIANIMCAYLSQGKRVLATSKNAPALSVLRERMPPSIRDLCVDVSTSELTGMRQLQQTVERLANRISCANVNVEFEKCELLKRNIERLEKELQDLDQRITCHARQIQSILREENGEFLIREALDILEAAPWLLKMVPKWEIGDFISLRSQLSQLIVPDGDPLLSVEGLPSMPSHALVRLANSRAGSFLSSLTVAAEGTLASIPLVGTMLGAINHSEKPQDQLSKIRIQGRVPTVSEDWSSVVRALKHAQAVSVFDNSIWRPHVYHEGWPSVDFSIHQRIREMETLVTRALEVKKVSERMNIKNELDMMAKCRAMGQQRSRLAQQLQHLAAELADATVITELSRSFSPDAQSALIKFAQIAGKAKFNRSSQPAMTQRQRRRRQEYLDAFNQCCRFIPCWILTSSQISDYFPAEECLFDLVIVDESSQSDVTVLPGLLRGKQWLIVGDGKQVSPTECFISEDVLDSLRSALPDSPLENMLLPGQSFFDLCSQAFPRGRVILREHFRCAEEIISFSNHQYYSGMLVPLRLPAKSERLYPSLVDVVLTNGKKVGKVNSVEADKIVQMIIDITKQPGEPRSIGVISLMGDEQSRLIRGRLLDAIGPEKMSRHLVLVGDPPSFQGAERDIVFLSMVCSRGAVPTQNQLLHAQRANVALSRARDRCVLVRSIGLSDIASQDDIKIAIINFFQTNDSARNEQSSSFGQLLHTKETKKVGRALIRDILTRNGFRVSSMGGVWRDALCIEDKCSDERVALLIDCDGESEEEWQRSYWQQKAIERVGWRCARVDALSLIYNHFGAMDYIRSFLREAGIQVSLDPAVVTDSVAVDFESSRRVNANVLRNEPESIEVEADNQVENVGIDEVPIAAIDDAIFVSSDEISAASSAGVSSHGSLDADAPARFGEVVDLGFLVTETRASRPAKRSSPSRKRQRSERTVEQPHLNPVASRHDSGSVNSDVESEKDESSLYDDFDSD